MSRRRGRKRKVFWTISGGKVIYLRETEGDKCRILRIYGHGDKEKEGWKPNSAKRHILGLEIKTPVQG